MGAGESKVFNQELKQFPEEEQQILVESFRKLANAKKNVDRKTLEVKIVTSCFNAVYSKATWILIFIQEFMKRLLDIPDVDLLSCRICDLMTGKISTLNCVTFEGYIHFATIIINGVLDEKAGEIVYLASGKGNSATIEELQQVTYFESS